VSRSLLRILKYLAKSVFVLKNNTNKARLKNTGLSDSTNMTSEKANGWSNNYFGGRLEESANVPAIRQ